MGIQKRKSLNWDTHFLTFFICCTFRGADALSWCQTRVNFSAPLPLRYWGRSVSICCSRENFSQQRIWLSQRLMLPTWVAKSLDCWVFIHLGNSNHTSKVTPAFPEMNRYTSECVPCLNVWLLWRTKKSAMCCKSISKVTAQSTYSIGILLGNLQHLLNNYMLFSFSYFRSLLSNINNFLPSFFHGFILNR